MSSRLIGRRHVSLQLQRCPCFCLPFCLLQTSLNQLLLMSTVDEAEAVAAPEDVTLTLWDGEHYHQLTLEQPPAKRKAKPKKDEEDQSRALQCRVSVFGVLSVVQLANGLVVNLCMQLPLAQTRCSK